jgi:hypothetical protein
VGREGVTEGVADVSLVTVAVAEISSSSSDAHSPISLTDWATWVGTFSARRENFSVRSCERFQTLSGGWCVSWRCFARLLQASRGQAGQAGSAAKVDLRGGRSVGCRRRRQQTSRPSSGRG